MNNNFKSGFVTIIGRPNVGKSTLMNHLIGQKIAITSNKPQTTRNRIQTVYTDMDKGQIVFVDTPGIHKAKNKLGEYMVNVAEKTLNEVDVVLWLVEPSNFIGAGEQHIIEKLQRVNTPVILIINKVDTVDEKEKILEYIDTYRKVYDFAEIVPLSALRGQNTEILTDLIFKYLPYGPQFYDEDTITDQPERQIVAEVIREKALHALNEEIPHGIAVSVDKMKVRKGKKIIDIDATIVCEKDSHKGIIIGKQVIICWYRKAHHGNSNNIDNSIRQGGIFMGEETWKQFMSTGRVTDYLAYKMIERMADSEQKARGVAKHGAESGVDRNGAVSDTHRGLR